jgi:SAM-dependent methyltransferase
MDADAWNARYGAAELVWSAQPNEFLVAEVTELPAGRALDVACGEGRNAIWLAEQGWDVTGVDFSPVAIDKARRLAETRGVTVTWLLADVETDIPQLAAFDLVAVFYLQLASQSRRTAFGAAAAAVAPGGTLLVVGHDTTNLTDGWGGPGDAAVLYGPDDIVIDIAGLEIVKALRVERRVLTDDGPKTAIDVLVRAIRPA